MKFKKKNLSSRTRFGISEMLKQVQHDIAFRNPLQRTKVLQIIYERKC